MALNLRPTDDDFADAVSEALEEFQPNPRRTTMAQHYTGHENATAQGKIYGDASTLRTSPFDSLSNSVDGIREVASRISALAEQIAGQRPPQPVEGNPAKSLSHGGLVDVVERATDSLQGLRNSIMEDIERIERRL